MIEKETPDEKVRVGCPGVGLPVKCLSKAGSH